MGIWIGGVRWQVETPADVLALLRSVEAFERIRRTRACYQCGAPAGACRCEPA